MNYTFNNSSIVSVNSGTIVLNVSGKTRTFADAKLVSAVDGKIVLDLPEASFKKGSYLVMNWTVPKGIFILSENTDIKVYYHVYIQGSDLTFNSFWYKAENKFRNATPEEIQELNDQLAAAGKQWNPATMQIEKLRWKPKKGELYFTILLRQVVEIAHYSWSGDKLDTRFYEMGNCFKTEEEAIAKFEEIKKLFLNV
jgi:hypothetical protein